MKKDLILESKTMSKKLEAGSYTVTKQKLAELKDLTIALKKLSLDCSKEGINTQPLIKLLSIIYDSIGISKGFAAVLKSKTIQSPIVMNRENLITLSDLILEEMWTAELILTDLQTALEDLKDA